MNFLAAVSVTGVSVLTIQVHGYIQFNTDFVSTVSCFVKVSQCEKLLSQHQFCYKFCSSELNPSHIYFLLRNNKSNDNTIKFVGR